MDPVITNTHLIQTFFLSQLSFY